MGKVDEISSANNTDTDVEDIKFDKILKVKVNDQEEYYYADTELENESISYSTILKNKNSTCIRF